MIVDVIEHTQKDTCGITVRDTYPRLHYLAYHKRVVLCRTQFTANTVEDNDEANEDDIRSFGLMENEPLLDNTNKKTYPKVWTPGDW